MRRARTIVAGLSVSVLAAGSAVAATGAHPPSRPVPSHRGVDVPREVEENLGKSLVEEAKQNPQAKVPRNRDDLLASAKRHRGRVTAGEARTLIRKGAPSLLVGDKIVPDSDDVVGVLGDRALQVAVKGGKTQALVSSMPLARLESGSRQRGTAKYTVSDLDWRTSGERFVMKRPVDEVSLPQQSDGTVRLEGGQGFRLAPADSDAHGSVSGESVTYPNIARDTDMTVRSLPSGFGVGWSLRSPDALRELRVPVDLPKGQHLEKSADGSIAIEGAGGDVETEITPAIATDADQQPVELDTRVDGDTITYEVKHESGDTAYPVTVDPYAVPQGSVNAGWRPQNTPQPTAPYQYFGSSLNAGTLSIFAPAGYYAQYESASWARQAPGNPGLPRGSNEHSRWTTFTAGGFGYTWYGQQYYHVYNRAYGKVFVADQNGAIQQTTDVPAGTSGATYTITPPTPTIDNQIGFGLTLDGGYFFQYDHPQAAASMAWYTAQAADYVGPTPTTTYQGQWLNPASNPRIAIRATDNGLGLKSIDVRDVSGAVLDGTSALYCAPHDNELCPFTTDGLTQQTGELTKSVSGATEGANAARVHAVDAGDTSGDLPFTLRIDRSGPDLTLNGPLYNRRTEQLLPNETRGLSITAADGVPGGTGAQQRSGVQKIETYLDADLVQTDTQTQSGDSRGLVAAWDGVGNNISVGSHTIRVVATDRIGNTREATFTFTKAPNGDSQTPSADVAGELVDLSEGYVPRYRQAGITLTGEDADDGLDDGSGVQRLGLKVDGQTLLDRAVDCSPSDGATGCPGEAEQDATVDLSGFAEGTHSAQTSATDASGKTGYSDSWNFSIDRTPPAQVSSFTATKDSDKSDTVIAWAGDEDPELATSTTADPQPGSGTTSWQVRYAVGATDFSPWANTTDPFLRIPDQLIGLPVRIEIKSTDGAGNTSTSAGQTNVEADPGALPIGDDDPGTTPTPQARAGGGSPGLVACSERYPADVLNRAIFRFPLATFGFSAVAGYVTFRCYIVQEGELASKIITSIRARASVCVEVQDAGGDWQTAGCKIASFGRAPTRVAAVGLCRAGDRAYRLRWSSRIYSSKGPVFNIPPQERTGVQRTLSCDEAGAFRRQAVVNSQTPQGSPNYNLGENLKTGFNVINNTYNSLDIDPLPANGAYNYGRKGWDAHHIIPYGRNKNPVPEVQRAAWACQVPANAAVNGIWARGRKLKSDRSGYRNLSTAERRRIYHLSTFSNDEYFALLRDRLAGFYQANGGCNRGAFYSALRDIRAILMTKPYFRPND